MNFGQQKASTPATTNFMATPNAQSASSTSSLFNLPRSSTTTNAPTTSGNLSFNTPTQKTPVSSTSQPKQTLTVAATSLASTQATTMPNFSSPIMLKPATTSTVTFGGLKTTAASSSTPTVTTIASTATPTLGVAISTVSATTSGTLSLGSTAAPLGSGASTLGSTGSTLGTVAPSGGNKTGTSTTQQPQAITFQQLEELILNKWTAELYEQEKVFLNQATQINILDKVINENTEKLTQLQSTMEKVRMQQTKINDDLEVIATHQKDLEACLIPLEKEDLSSVLKGDPNRKNLYSNAKKIDSKIKSMSENLKETIEHINETSRSHDTDDPVIQVGRILNAHMESLRWIDEHTARMQDYFDSLLKIHDDLRRECDLSKHDVY